VSTYVVENARALVTFEKDETTSRVSWRSHAIEVTTHPGGSEAVLEGSVDIVNDSTACWVLNDKFLDKEQKNKEGSICGTD
jgi:hypothetical protein